MREDKLIFEQSSPGRRATVQAPAADLATPGDIPAEHLRSDAPLMPEVSELQVVRHYTRLSQRNFSIDTHFYPLGSCTMKYNPRASNRLAMLPGFLDRHPWGPASHGQGYMACVWELQEMLAEVTGLDGCSLTPMAGAQGEFAGVAMIRAYHRSRNDDARTEILVPDAAHGTNPATAVMCGYTVREIPTDSDGDVDMEALREAVGPKTAGIMLTNPSTLGVFERRIKEMADLVHGAGGLLYYDGANLNAILGKARPGDMGFDVIHINLHKTFSTPHGGGGPGAGAIGVGKRLLPFMPLPVVERAEDGSYQWLTEKERPQTIGRLSAFMGNAGVILRAYVYARMLGREGMIRVSEFATLNANYVMTRLREEGFQVWFRNRRASHEFIISFRREAKEYGITAMDVAKRLLDYGYHAPTTYFPLLVPECLLIEPTETETREELDGFVEAMVAIRKEGMENIDTLKGAPYTMPVRRLDEVRAAKELDLVWHPAAPVESDAQPKRSNG
ncbi:glycine dehydrogenase subunit 2 [Natronocella acetinitrilica]|uniref:Probable glycine dehydrogenase (decarboxylating) subunit 2 n=1 Tax=Natronocella acetinitrilica TaxID=414046 RepID=A0AAE3G8P8_9GAMM|nr:aminomethyl-transferring glycine dehydrogenase subunit GcvPB [Natronocella acetinitrilica]MCP1676811.1 glycine dehydrogenase subunit 2 [Natronocella acetinitrilica]